MDKDIRISVRFLNDDLAELTIIGHISKAENMTNETDISSWVKLEGENNNERGLVQTHNTNNRSKISLFL